MALPDTKSSGANNLAIPPSLLFALLGSVLLHLGLLLFGGPMKPSPLKYVQPRLEARLAPSAAAVSPFTSPSTLSATPRTPALVDAPPIATPIPTSPIAPAVTEISVLAQAATHSGAVSDEPPVVVAQSGLVSVDASAPDPTYYPVEQLDESPRLLGDIQQSYPTRARNAGVEGYVILSLLISERGEVDEINVVKAQPIGFFEASAIATLRGQHFSPAIKQGKAVRSRWQKTVRYKLQG